MNTCKPLAALILLLATATIFSQNTENPITLSVAKIMQDPLVSIGSLPSNIYWSDDSKMIYFSWNPEKADADSLYKVAIRGGQPEKVSVKKQQELPANSGDYDRNYKRKVYAKNGDLYLLTTANGNIQRLTHTVERESNPQFSQDEKHIIYTSKRNIYLRRLSDGMVKQVTDFRSGQAPKKDSGPHNENEKWLEKEERKLIRILRERADKSELSNNRREQNKPDGPKEIHLGSKRIDGQQLSPDQRFVTYRLITSASGAKRTNVPDYVREDGFTENLPARAKVGSPIDKYEFAIYDTKRDTVYYLDEKQIPGIYDQPAFLATEADTSADGANKTPRSLVVYGPYWSDNGARAVVVVRAWDNKDRWIMALDPAEGKLSLLHREHNDAWVGGPGISGWVFFPGDIGWMPDNRRVWFQSESSGYSHLYTADVLSKKVVALTSGNFEVTDAQLSRNGKTWFLTTSEVHPGERHFYHMPANGGKRTKITTMEGNHQVTVSPDEKTLAIRYSSGNEPWQLFLMANKAKAAARQITNDLSEQFRSYNWRKPENVTFTAGDGATVHARLYRPSYRTDTDPPIGKGPAVIFVHGAGYLQNAHKWWSTYFREYMFHNLLADNGYTVLDIDYRASAGYGRDWRTGIYRHMGGKDLSDHVDGAQYLIDQLNVDPASIGIYGGSYGGFITFMALFTEPDVFACGAALRPVSDWAHYNHPYTSNILNEPQLDTLAYQRSSPIYHAEGLTKPLLICHGMIDTNVHFQDVVRLAQRLIELGKEDWEVALYPLEGHGFREPSSWTDEYRRIFKLFETYLK